LALFITTLKKPPHPTTPPPATQKNFPQHRRHADSSYTNWTPPPPLCPSAPKAESGTESGYDLFFPLPRWERARNNPPLAFYLSRAHPREYRCSPLPCAHARTAVYTRYPRQTIWTLLPRSDQNHCPADGPKAGCGGGKFYQR